MNKLILVFLAFFQCLTFFSCKSIDSSSKDVGMRKLNVAKKSKDGGVVQYEVLGESYYSSGISAQGIYIARSFEDVVSIMEGDNRNDEFFSKIDFENEALVFVFAGTFNTGGYSIKVDSIKRIAKNKISAVFSITSPAPDSIVTQAFTHPSIIVSVKVNKADIIQASFK